MTKIVEFREKRQKAKERIKNACDDSLYRSNTIMIKRLLDIEVQSKRNKYKINQNGKACVNLFKRDQRVYNRSTMRSAKKEDSEFSNIVETIETKRSS